MAENHKKIIGIRHETKQSLIAEISHLRKTITDLEEKLQTKTAAENSNKTRNLKQKLLSDFASFAIESLSDGAFLIAKDASLVYVNRAACEQLGYTEEELLSMRVMDFNPHLTQEIWDSIWGVTVRDKLQSIEVEHLTKDGRIVSFEVLANHIELYGEQYSCSFTRDISERKRAEHEMQKLATAVDHSADWIFIADIEGTIQYVNKSVETISGYARGELIGKTPRIFKSGKHDHEFYQQLWKTISSGKTFSGILMNRKKTGEPFELHYTITPLKDNEGNIHHFVATAKDITEKKLLEERLDYLAYYDSLTGLPNKRLFADRLTQSLSSAEQKSVQIGILFVDIARFTSFNETYGHETGNEILKEAGRRLSQEIFRDCIIGRIDADKFGVILTDMQHSEDVILAIEKMQSIFKNPIRVGREDIIISLNAGITMFPGDGKDTKVLMQNAEVALAKAKTHGINMYEFFTVEMNNRAREFFQMQRHLFKALELNEFVIHYQPYFDSITLEMLGMEALIRWNSPEFGLVLPGLFIPILEETGMIIDVGKWILQTVCRQIREWMDKGYKSAMVPVHVNLSLAQFNQRDLSDFIEKTIDDTGIYRNFLGFEITESIFMQDIKHTQAVLDNLRHGKFSVSIDDFGTGYSSLSNLKRLPLNNLKIDHSFIRDVTNNSDDAAIVITIISMAHNLNLKTIAEGVENEEQWKLLRVLKCDMIQGYHLSKPVSAEEIEELLLGGANEHKRQHRRCSVKGFADLTYKDQEKNQVFHTFISDISLSGACLYSDALLKQDLDVSLTICLISGPGSIKTDTIDGRIIYSKKIEQMYFIGIEFLEEMNRKNQPSLYEYMQKILI